MGRKRTLGLGLFVTTVVLGAAAVSASADVVGPPVTMQILGGEPAMINAPDILNPRANNGGLKVMTLNPATGVIYGMDTYVSNNGRAETFLLDSSVVSTPSSPLDAQVGTLAAVAGSQYTGSVRGDGGTTDNSTINPPNGADITFNPDFNEGAMVCLSGYNTFVANEWAVQDTSVGWGRTVEPNGVNTAANYAKATVAFGGYSQGVREAFGYLDQATVTGGTHSDVYRYVWGYKKTGIDSLRVAHVATGFSTAPTDLTTGARSAEQRGGGFMLMDSSQLYSLAPAGTGLNGLAVRGEVTADVFDVYMLFTDATSTYLTAIQATIPADGSALSYEVIDLDGSSANTYLQLVDNTAGGGGADIEGTSLVFSGDGSTLYVAAYLDYATGDGNYDPGRIYIYNVPEPATIGLLGLGLLPLLRRRHRRRG